LNVLNLFSNTVCRLLNVLRLNRGNFILNAVYCFLDFVGLSGDNFILVFTGGFFLLNLSLNLLDILNFLGFLLCFVNRDLFNNLFDVISSDILLNLLSFLHDVFLFVDFVFFVLDFGCGFDNFINVSRVCFGLNLSLRGCLFLNTFGLCLLWLRLDSIDDRLFCDFLVNGLWLLAWENWFFLLGSRGLLFNHNSVLLRLYGLSCLLGVSV